MSRRARTRWNGGPRGPGRGCVGSRMALQIILSRGRIRREWPAPFDLVDDGAVYVRFADAVLNQDGTQHLGVITNRNLMLKPTPPYPS